MEKRTMTTAEQFAAEYALACDNDLELDEVMQRITDATAKIAEVPGRGEGDGVVHIFEDDSWFDDKTQEIGSSTAKFERQSDGSLIIKYS